MRRYVDRLPAFDIDVYVDLHRRLKLSFCEQNLLDAHHPEFEDILVDTVPTEIQRGAYGTLMWEF